VKVKEIMRFMADMTLRTDFPVPVPQGFSYKWAEGYRFNRKGEVMLYTGALYQLVPYIESLSAFLKSIERSDVGAFLALRTASHLPPKLLMDFLPEPDKKLVEFSNKTLRSIAGLLIKNGVEFSYLYEDDIYSGVLLYDMMLLSFVYALWQANGSALLDALKNSVQDLALLLSLIGGIGIDYSGGG